MNVIDNLRKEFGHAMNCGCDVCHQVGQDFPDTQSLIRAANEGLDDLSINEVSGKDIIIPALKLFLRRNYKQQRVFERHIYGAPLR